MDGLLLDDIWTEQGGISVRFIALKSGYLQIELTEGVSRPATHIVTLTDYRARRLAQVLSGEYLSK